MYIYIYIYIFDSPSKDDNGYISSTSTTGFLKIDTLHSLENYIRYIYHNPHLPTESVLSNTIYNLATLSMQEVPVNVHWKRGDCQQSSKKTWKLKRENVMIHKCKDSFKNRYEDKRESITEYKIYVGNQMSNITYQKVRYQENLEVQLVYKKCR